MLISFISVWQTRNIFSDLYFFCLNLCQLAMCMLLVIEAMMYVYYTQMEAVGAFIEGCKKYGLTEKDCCVTLDIYEKQAGDQNMVRIIM